ncbi:MAG: ABC transporter ATP-binding protein [Verrucomicrobiota bacterium]
MANAIEIAGLTKDFPVAVKGKRLRAVDDLSLSVGEGEVYGLLGPNGSGKSTTIKALLGLLKPTKGSCSVFGSPCSEVSTRLMLGYLPEAPYFPRFMSGLELVIYFGELCGLKKSEAEERGTELLEELGLAGAREQRIGTYSKGMLQRLGMAQALVGDPKVVILDEPTAGVDPIGARDIGQIILRQKEMGKTVLLCSHLLSHVESLCDRVAILNRGKLMTEGRVEDLLSDGDASGLLIEGLSEEKRVRLIAEVESNGGRVSKRSKSLSDLFMEQLK